jgi:hypothetical protein
MSDFMPASVGRAKRLDGMMHPEKTRIKSTALGRPAATGFG